MKATVVKTGFWNIDRKLVRLSGREAKAVIRKASRAAIKPIQQQAKGNAKKNKESGTTFKNIKTRSMSRSRVRVGSKVTIDGKNFPKKFYAKFQELGWKSIRGRKMEGNQDLRGAANDKKQMVLRKFKGDIKYQIEKLARKK